MSFMSLNWAPASDTAVFAGALNLHNEFPPPTPACPGIFPGDGTGRAAAGGGKVRSSDETSNDRGAKGP